MYPRTLKIHKRIPHNQYMLLFNVLINDVVYFIRNCDLYNYADDNTLSFHSPDFDEMIKVLQVEGKMLINGFALTACRLIQKRFRPLVQEKERMKDLQLSNLDPSKLHAMKKLKFWVLI